MWLFNQPPRTLLQERYQFDATDTWLDHVQKSSVRFNSGGSGSFVSEDGLLISNHHVGADALQKSARRRKIICATVSGAHAGRGGQMPRSRTQRAPVHRGRDRAHQCRRAEGCGRRRRLRRASEDHR